MNMKQKRYIRRYAPRTSCLLIWVSFVLILLGILWLWTYGFGLSTQSFPVSDGAEFYVVAANAIDGYRLNEGVLEQVASSDIEVVKKNVNQAVKRAELADRYLVFTDDAWPMGRDEGIVTVDFQEGIVKFLPTAHNAYTAAGATDEYYFASTTGGGSNISIFDGELAEIETIQLDPPVILADFGSSEDSFLFIGTDVAASQDASGNMFFKNALFRAQKSDQTFTVERIGDLETNDYCQYWLTETLYKDNQLFALSPGYREHQTYQRISSSAVYVYDAQTKEGIFYPLEADGIEHMYQLDDRWIAISHSSKSSGLPGITLFALDTFQSIYISLPNDTSDEEIWDIEPLNESVMLVLMDHRLYGYDRGTDELLFSESITQPENHAVDLWIAR